VKILMILGTGAILTFPMDKSVIPDCFSQGHAILQKLAVYDGPGPTQGWILKNARIPIEVAGWYCR
jgi:hypothetical protein